MSSASTSITLFTSIPSIAPALLEQQTSGHDFAFEEIIDLPALNGYGGTVFFEPDKLSEESVEKLKEATILVTEPHVLAKVMEYEATNKTKLLPKLKWCQSTYAGEFFPREGRLYFISSRL